LTEEIGPRQSLSPRQFPTEDAADEERKAQARKDADFELPPEREAYYEARTAADIHRERLAAMSVKERHEYMRGLRVGLAGDGSKSKKGDLDNPLRKDLPKEPRAPRPPAAPRPPSPTAQLRRMQALARKARGRR